VKISQYSIKRVRLDRELRDRSRILAFGLDAFRHAQIMALLILLLDLTPWAFYEPGESAQRASFVLGWAILMATIYLFRPSFLEVPLEKLERDASA
jgi:formate-dependent nitrite reductase membrane component NrfD